MLILALNPVFTYFSKFPVSVHSVYVAIMLLGMQANVLHPSGTHAGAVTKGLRCEASLTVPAVKQRASAVTEGLQFGANVSALVCYIGLGSNTQQMFHR